VLGALPSFAPTGIPGLDEAGIDRTVLAFSVGVSVSAGLLFGMVPALRASRGQVVTRRAHP